ncbi:MAG: DUF547 domain-containing protein [Pseudomonadota bacterium]
MTMTHHFSIGNRRPAQTTRVATKQALSAVHLIKQTAIALALAATATIALSSSADAAPKALDSYKAFAETRTVEVDHSAWDAFLGRYVKTDADGLNRLDYGAVTADDRAALETYIASLEATEVAQLTRNQQMAFWINLYNAVTVRAILEEYPVKSIKRVGGSLFSPGPWKDKRISLGGDDLTLDNIEHNILRPIFADNRVHYAVNCASIGCPNLAAKAFRADELDAMLTEGARAYIASERGASFNGEKLTVSSIYKWFDEDFGGNQAGILEHLRQFAEGEKAEKLATTTRISSYDYDWGLNDVE